MPMGLKYLLCQDYLTNTGMNMAYARRKGDLILGEMAEREGFEPSVGLRPQRFSRPSRSTTPAPLLQAQLSAGAHNVVRDD